MKSLFRGHRNEVHIRAVHSRNFSNVPAHTMFIEIHRRFSCLFRLVVYKYFFREICLSNDAPMGRHFPCIFKNVDVGYCGKLSVVRERGLVAVTAP